MFRNQVFQFWNMVVSLAVFLVLPAELALLPIGWLLLSSIAGSIQVRSPIKA